ncbi:MAG: hypothetical protein A3C70_00810 [Candidatus Zambryskibacteria bacterium RIFCSPHIGHO2_02_FULL_43_14]|uniref:Uncharacterized protein n=1 Tax=Candidatus Zambryskibacteria bacterium RIFCSPHIGHO2_02_FULL_43_14 TaxID=1802748 RepID=A0A1G2TFZ3_9BACT|nr:MAG: hypothetical protein A2829_02855 [Candidatus Zambryskibacteria bacterium RIFCSPHIGHO2_01_FULL_43_60]OHA95551.1 MAG: hypothetical protein A3C70_00810 [Candidatus Zambryskibacteria bacterium RIFCSPHIGHO2_02_FULL_43_14]OHB02905.1 MAG: hypothetical protein A3B03_03250 [Candidatus Zambryskibacteria bacterium RIFCSPLOWO2_01_FULL_42_41]
MSKIAHFFDKFENKIRGFLSRYPIVYGFISGVGIVSFWRGVWETSDIIGIPPQASLLFGFLVLLAIGVLVTEFLGNRLIISGLRGEKKLEEKTLKEIEEEELSLSSLKDKINRIEKMLEKLSNTK